jgi:multicomponent Na+:H+ antiporter subunit F
MTTLFSVAALAILATVVVGLLRVVIGPTRSDRMMGAQLLGTGGIAVLLLVGTADRTSGAIEVALVLAVLAPFATIAFARFGSPAIQKSARRSGP